MSAIGGIFYRSGSVIPPEISENFMNKLGKYKYDDKGQWKNSNVFLGCFMNWITPESVNEKLPFHSKNANLTITADAIIDNREELFKELKIPKEDGNTISDSLLILKAYEKWDEKCPKFLIGDFSFAIWDEKKKSLFCARDHVGKRTFYYSLVDNAFTFSTLIKPLFQIPEVNRELDDTWIGGFLGITSVRSSLDPEITSYSSVKQLLPAHTMTVSSSGVKFNKYWEIKKGNTLQLESDEDYEEAFRKVFTEAVKCRMRCIGQVGVMMSGGLDSGSVACIAAQELKKKGGRLKAFSHVPLEEYENWLPKNKIGDETPYINSIKDHCGNIDVNFCRIPEKNSYNVIDKTIDVIEQPYKSIGNSYWMEGIIEHAKNENVKVILDGQTGNGTVSWGNFISGCLTFIEMGDFKTLRTEVKEYSKIQNMSPNRVILRVIKNYIPSSVIKGIHKLKGVNLKTDSLSPINKEFAQKIKLTHIFKKYDFDPFFLKRTSSFSARMKMLNPSTFTHLGAYETKVSLAYGVCRRDPTRDKRVIEFCMSLPEYQYVRKGKERQLIRRAMKNILPDKVRLNDYVRGKQAADWVERISPIWEEIKNEYYQEVKNNYADKYLDIERGIEYIKKLDGKLKPSKKEIMKLKMIMRSIIFMKFINKENIGS